MKRKRHTKTRTTRLLTMDELRARPCEVDGRPALFHRWIEADDVLRVCGSFRDYEIPVAHYTFALVEYDDGTIAKVLPEMIRFTEMEGQA